MQPWPTRCRRRWQRRFTMQCSKRLKRTCRSGKATGRARGAARRHGGHSAPASVLRDGRPLKRAIHGCPLPHSLPLMCNLLQFDVRANMYTLVAVTGVILFWRGVWNSWGEGGAAAGGVLGVVGRGGGGTLQEGRQAAGAGRVQVVLWRAACPAPPSFCPVPQTRCLGRSWCPTWLQWWWGCSSCPSCEPSTFRWWRACREDSPGFVCVFIALLFLPPFPLLERSLLSSLLPLSPRHAWPLPSLISSALFSCSLHGVMLTT